jgi:hypothetical protein
MSFILGLILFILLLRFLPRLFLWWVQRKIRKTVNRTEETFEETPAPSTKRKKRIEKDKGDYVDFEEMN